MKTRILLCFAAVFVLQCCTAQDLNCHSNSGCAPDECCAILSRAPIWSKRNLLIPLPAIAETGTCRKYQQANDWCNHYDELNGLKCGCASGLTCIFERTGNKRNMPPNFGPGGFQCE